MEKLNQTLNEPYFNFGLIYVSMSLIAFGNGEAQLFGWMTLAFQFGRMVREARDTKNEQ